MYILDTDHMSVLQRDSADAARLEVRLSMAPPEEIYSTIVSYEEQVRGWLAQIARARTEEARILAYALLADNLQGYCAAKLLPYDEQAVEEMERLKPLKLRIGTQDLKIAAITLANGATLLSRNLRHFEQVPNLSVEDWTA